MAALRAYPRRAGRDAPRVWPPPGTPLDVLRTAVSLLGAELGWRPTHDIDHDELRSQALRLCAVVPTLLTAVYRLQQGQEPVPPRDDLSATPPTTCGCCSGEEAPADHVRAIEQYLMLTIDHGFNASTFAARVITSTGADLAASVVGAIGALSGPLHGGAPSRALAMLDSIGTPDRAEPWIRDAVARGDRIMGFGHRVYKTDDPRSVFLREVARSLGGDLVDFAEEVERTDGRRAGRAQAGSPALHQRRVLRRGGDAHLWHPPRDVHPDLRLQPHHRLGHPRHGAGRRQPPDPSGGALRRSAPAPAGARRLKRQPARDVHRGRMPRTAMGAPRPTGGGARVGRTATPSRCDR